MSFEIFDVEFKSEDDFELNSLKMKDVIHKVGEKFLNEWIMFGLDENVIDDIDNVNQIYRWIKSYEESNYKDKENVDWLIEENQIKLKEENNG